jgi:MATE family multidrug resistance protein
MEAAINTTYACRIFQLPCILLAMMAQVCVGRLYGAREWNHIGPVIWQFIWFSILSMLIVYPLSKIYGKIYFEGTAIAPLALPYYRFFIAINFLYPLGAALSCFYLGRGKTRFIVGMRLASELLTVLLSYALMFGKGGMPQLGLLGGAIAALIGQGTLCLVLLFDFLRHSHAEAYGSWNWRFQPKLFWESTQPGLLRSFSSILNSASWASIARLMALKGDAYLLVLSIGGTLFLFLSCIGDAICQSMTSMVSQLLGMKRYHQLKHVFRSGVMLTFILNVLIGLFLLFFSGPLFRLFFPDIILSQASIHRIFLGVWLSISGYTFIFVPISYILAFKDTKFSLLMGAFAWINGFLLMWFFIQRIEIAADHFWIFLSLMHFSSVLCYLLRMRKLTAPFKKETVLAEPIVKA